MHVASSLPRLAFRLAVAAAVLLGGSAGFSPRDADACGGFFPRKITSVPSLAAEQVLIVHDQARGLEHFVREVAFRDGGEPFGFVVPVPARPEVASVKKRPFASLERDFPMRFVAPGMGGKGSRGGVGLGGPEGGGVTVLEVKQVGSFKAFVLAATDASGLRRWLDDNRFTTTPASEKWLDVYVKQQFFFVALRHEAPATPGKKPRHQRVIAETIRLSFATPVAYYPYREPDHETLAPPAGERKDRLVALWLVTNGGPQVPVAMREAEGERPRELVRPFRENENVYSPPLASVATTVGDELKAFLPAPAEGRDSLTVQVFEDQKVSRRGFGDVLFVPTTPREAPLADEKRLATLLDPSLAGAP